VDVLRLAEVPYIEAWELQRDLAARRAEGTAPDTLILLEHPDVYTAGRRTEAWERPADGTPVVDVDRGGKITWHGPGQLVGYPIVELPRPLDVVAYVRVLEDAMIAVCAEFGVPTHRVEGRSGVWTLDDERKLGAIGIRVRRRVTYHGFALNCCPDLRAFGRIVPCGITDASAGSLSGEVGRTVTVAEARPVVERHLVAHLAAFLAGGRPSDGDGALLAAPEPTAVPA
jgi:lipoyl(octanoyl) transferase